MINLSPDPVLNPVPPLYDPMKAKRVKLRTHTTEHLLPFPHCCPWMCPS